MCVCVCVCVCVGVYNIDVTQYLELLRQKYLN